MVGTGSVVGYYAYRGVYSSNVSLGIKEKTYFYIHTGADVQDVIDSLYHKGYIVNRNTFEWVLNQKNYANNIHPGKYLLKDDMSNNDLVNLLRSGEQVPVKVAFNNVRTLDEMADKVSHNLEFTKEELMNLLSSPEVYTKYGFNESTFATMFLPNTYEFYWNTSATDFIDRMASEYKQFWTEERKAKAKKAGLSQSEVSILASLVESEQNMKYDEQPTIAGLYINRIRKNMLLQCDPTVKFACQDLDAQRVTNAMLEKDSPYNTYKYPGLPPGPIRLPSIRTIKSVLNYEQHGYIYMCAKEDFSGYHNFAKTYNQHLVYARRYQRELNKRRIYQ